MNLMHFPVERFATESNLVLGAKGGHKPTAMALIVMPHKLSSMIIIQPGAL
jgi:hypothetical protein